MYVIKHLVKNEMKPFQAVSFPCILKKFLGRERTQWPLTHFSPVTFL